MRIGRPEAMDCVMRSFRASSGMISAVPLVMRSSWSSSEGKIDISFKYKDHRQYNLRNVSLERQCLRNCQKTAPVFVCFTSFVLRRHPERSEGPLYFVVVIPYSQTGRQAFWSFLDRVLVS